MPKYDPIANSVESRQLRLILIPPLHANKTVSCKISCNASQLLIKHDNKDSCSDCASRMDLHLEQR